MKKMLLFTVGFAALGMAPIVAADLPARTYTKAPPAAAGSTTGPVSTSASSNSLS
jgi:hypothetical protein